MAETLLHNVHDRRRGWIGSWEVAPLDIAALTEADVGRTVIYQDHGRAEAGTLTSWRGDVVFARYSRGDTAAGANASALVFGVRRRPFYLYLERALEAQPSTAEDPNEDSYQRGRFDGVMEFGRSIAALLRQTTAGNDAP